MKHTLSLSDESGKELFVATMESEACPAMFEDAMEAVGAALMRDDDSDLPRMGTFTIRIEEAQE